MGNINFRQGTGHRPAPARGMCVPSSYLSTHGVQMPDMSEIEDMEDMFNINYECIEYFHDQEGYTRLHLNVDNYKGDKHRMPVSEIRYVPDKYFKVKSYDPGGMKQVFTLFSIACQNAVYEPFGVWLRLRHL